jgi:hypothetical protein
MRHGRCYDSGMKNVTGTARSLIRIQDTPNTQGGGKWSVDQAVNNDGVPQAQITLTNKNGDGKIGLTFLPEEARAFAEAILEATTPVPTCAYCGETIKGTRPGGRKAEYCSPAHRQAAYRERSVQRELLQQPVVGEWRYEDGLDPTLTTRRELLTGLAEGLVGPPGGE